MSVVICHTAGCPSAGNPVEVDLSFTDPDTGDTLTADPYCGACGQPITDIDGSGAAPEPEPKGADAAT